MRFRVKCVPMKGKRIIVDVASGRITEEPEEIFGIPVKEAKYKIIRGGLYEPEWIIECDEENAKLLEKYIIEEVKEDV